MKKSIGSTATVELTMLHAEGIIAHGTFDVGDTGRKCPLFGVLHRARIAVRLTCGIACLTVTTSSSTDVLHVYRLYMSIV